MKSGQLFADIFAFVMFYSGPVLSLAVTGNGEQCFSGGIDSTIQWWNIPSSNIDPYDTYGENMYLLLFPWNYVKFWGK